MAKQAGFLAQPAEDPLRRESEHTEDEASSNEPAVF